MRRVWATVVGVWATVAIVAVLAWSHAQAPSPVGGATTPTVVVVKGKNGKQRLVVVQPAGGAHATTQTSPAPPA